MNASRALFGSCAKYGVREKSPAGTWAVSGVGSSRPDKATRWIRVGRSIDILPFKWRINSGSRPSPANVVVSPRTLPPARGAFDAFRVLAAASDSRSTSVFVLPRAGLELNRDEMNAPPGPPAAGADCCVDEEDLLVKYALALPLFDCPFPFAPLTPLCCVAALAKAETSTKSSAPGATRARFAGRSSAGAGMIRLTTSGKVIGGSCFGFSTRRLAALFAFNLARGSAKPKTA